MGEICVLSERNCSKYHHVSYNTILGMENVIMKDSSFEVVLLSGAWYRINRVLRASIGRVTRDHSIRVESNKTYLFIAMNVCELEIYKETLRRMREGGNPVAVYLFDCWEPLWERVKCVLDYIQPSHIFLAYKKSAAHFKGIYDNVIWIPQSMDTEFFFDRNIKKTKLFMQMGRRTDSLHKMVLNYLDEHKMENSPDNYVYEREKGVIIYPDTNELSENICRTKYFICAPSCIENRRITGDISDVTARFYEAMACKTMIVGFKPETFDEIFGGDGFMAEINPDGSNFSSIIDFFENNQEEYKKIVEKNYLLVQSKHQWSNRISEMKKLLLGY